VIADKKIGCEVNVVYEPPDDGLVKAETCIEVNVKILHFVGV
jgi:hypothetical protein